MKNFVYQAQKTILLAQARITAPLYKKSAEKTSEFFEEEKDEE